MDAYTKEDAVEDLKSSAVEYGRLWIEYQNALAYDDPAHQLRQGDAVLDAAFKNGKNLGPHRSAPNQKQCSPTPIPDCSGH